MILGLPIGVAVLVLGVVLVTAGLACIVLGARRA